MPAPAVIPAPKAYTKIAVVKTLVVYMKGWLSWFRMRPLAGWLALRAFCMMGVFSPARM